ncbi:hypothetical protein Pla123a_08510 [Posidoniimonas polymericola]|uniref:Uncharacterized protein n=1 Tax=Posidoniimonas polymericola TaxID=2528002 RepID=A0A5C5YST7_9BACT|nr:hypothetical protein [Posidoniimonas polymericola]TWT78062.1 hypothetical protein Pla123a_08510 [Posidoniimonas polymericola]
MADRPRLKTPFDTPAKPPRPVAEAADPATPALPGPRRSRFRFTTRTFFALTFVLGFAAAGFNAVSAAGERKAYYVFFSLMAPVVAVIIAGAAHRLMRRFRQPPTDGRGPFDC